MKVILTFRWFCFEFKPAIRSCHEFLNCTPGRLLICGNFLSVWFYCFKYFHEFGWFSKYTAHRPQNLSRHSQCLNILYIRTFQFCRSPWFFELCKPEAVVNKYKKPHLLTKFCSERKRDQHWSIHIFFLQFQISKQKGATVLYFALLVIYFGELLNSETIICKSLSLF